MFRLTVDSIMKDFTRKVEELESLVVKHQETVSQNKVVVAKLEADTAAHETEIARARKVQAKLESILSI